MTFRILSIALLSILLLVGCGKDEKSETPAQPAMASGTTDAAGHTVINVGSYTVNVDVHNAAQAALPDIGVDAYLLHENVVVIARDSSGIYFPTIAVSGLAVTAKQAVPDHVQSPVVIAGTAVQSTIVMQAIQQGVYSFQTDPANMDLITSDAWTIETGHFGTLDQLRMLIDTAVAYNQGAYIRLSPSVAQAVGSGTRTAVFSAQSASDIATFAALVGIAFPIFQGDSLNFNRLTYANSYMPLVYIDNIQLHRNFWCQFTLIWGENPSDLDSHLWTPLFGSAPGDSALAHVCYYRRGSQDAPPYADLDVDDVTSYGPEHVTVYDNYPGTYVYAVHHYSGSGTFFSSGARVTLLKPDGTVQGFDAPADVPGVGDDWYWHVCQVDGQTGAVTPLNTYSPDPPRGDYLTDIPDRSLLKAAD
jgi:hypothetical protein